MPDYPESMRSEFKSRRDLICQRLNAMPGVTCHIPTGAFYVFPKVDVPGMNSEQIAMSLLEGGIVLPGNRIWVSWRGTSEIRLHDF